MSIPTGFRYLQNMALYLFKNLKQAYINDYGENLESKYDRAEKKLCQERIFCMDCEDFNFCKGEFWKGCKNRSMAMKIIKKKRGS